MVWKLRFRMYTFLGSFSFFLPDVCCCHFISSIISFLIGDTSSFSSFYTNSFDTACKIEVCFSSSLLIIWSCFLVHFAKKETFCFEAFRMIFQFLYAIQTLKQRFFDQYWRFLLVYNFSLQEVVSSLTSTWFVHNIS